MTKQFISTADTSKLIRKSLKEAFAGIKFSVRSKSYSGGSSVTITWTDGPNEAQVRAVVGRFEGASFDGRVDLKSYNERTMNGEPVHFGADFIFYNREYGEKVVAAVIRHLEKKYGPVQGDSPMDCNDVYWTWANILRRGLAKWSETVAANSATARQVGAITRTY